MFIGVQRNSELVIHNRSLCYCKSHHENDIMEPPRRPAQGGTGGRFPPPPATAPFSLSPSPRRCRSRPPEVRAAREDGGGGAIFAPPLRLAAAAAAGVEGGRRRASGGGIGGSSEARSGTPAAGSGARGAEFDARVAAGCGAAAVAPVGQRG